MSGAVWLATVARLAHQVAHMLGDTHVYEPQALLWAVLFGAGIYLVITGQPLGRPKPDLAARLHRLDPEARLRERTGQLQRDQSAQPMFDVPLVERVVRPVLDDIGSSVQGFFGLAWLWVVPPGFSRKPAGAGVKDLQRRLALVWPGVTPAQFFGEKVLDGAIGLLLVPLVGLLAGQAWPVWFWLVGLAAGFLAPDWRLARATAERRHQVQLELPVVLDCLSLAAAAGQGLEQALAEVGERRRGVVARELRGVTGQTALGQRTLVEALEAMAARNGMPELTAIVGQLCAAHRRGLPLVPALSAQADALREQKRLRRLEAGGRATVYMVIPVVLFLLPPLFAVVLFPAAVLFKGLAG